VETRILLADGQELVREGIRCVLESHEGFRVVCQVGDGESAVRRIEADKPDVAVLELTMPRLSGIGAIERVSASRSGTRCIVLSSNGGEQPVRDALFVGAAGYVLKTAPPSQLVAAIDAVHRGRFYFSPDVAGFVVAAARAPDGKRSGVLLSLTSREREVLQLVVEGLSTKEIATVLGISTRTSDSHRANVMEKLSIHKVSGLVRFAIREGLVDA
jgi:DNA-binding NarL/FixJ family response regulator